MTASEMNEMPFTMHVLS